MFLIGGIRATCGVFLQLSDKPEYPQPGFPIGQKYKIAAIRLAFGLDSKSSPRCRGFQYEPRIPRVQDVQYR